jgi:hypothetical protein
VSAIYLSCYKTRRISHGDLIEENAKALELHAWRRPLASSEDERD